MPLIIFTSSFRRINLVLVISLTCELMLLCSRCTEKGLIYIAIALPTGRQPLSCAECTKANMRSLCDIRSAFDTKCALLTSLCNLLVLCLICRRVLCLDGC